MTEFLKKDALKQQENKLVVSLDNVIKTMYDAEELTKNNTGGIFNLLSTK